MGQDALTERNVSESSARALLRGGSEEQLLARLRAGDERAVEELVGRYAGLVYRLALRLTGSPEDADDVTWEVMQKVWANVSSFRGDSALSSWIYRIAANAAYEKIRARRAPVLPVKEGAFCSMTATERPVERLQDWSALCTDPAEQAELRTVLERAIAELPLHHRAAVVLRDVEGLSNAQVAEVMGLSLSAVKSCVHRARLALRGRLAHEEGRYGESGTHVAHKGGKTMRMRSKGMTLLTAVSVLLASVGLIGAGVENRVDRVSNSGFSETVQRVETALKGKGMMIVATIDHQNMMRMVGASMKGSKTLEFGKPDMGKMTVVPNPEVGLEFPGKIYIWERADGKTVVSYYRAAPAFAAYGKDNLKMAGEMMDKMLDEIVAEATK